MRFNSVQQAAIFHTPQRSLKVTKEFQPKFASTDDIEIFLPLLPYIIASQLKLRAEGVFMGMVMVMDVANKCLGICARHLGKVETIPWEIKSIIQFKVCV